MVVEDDIFQYGRIMSTEEIGPVPSYPLPVSGLAGADSVFDALSFETL
jgi:hypothetical protein